MSDYTAVIIGRVSDRKGARLHLDILGRAHCGAGSGLIITDTRYEADATSARLPLCRRCRKAMLRALNEAAAQGSTAAADAVYMLTPAEQADAEDAALLAGIRAHLAEVWAEAPDPTWEERQTRVAALLAA